MIEQIVTLIGHLAWPVVVLVLVLRFSASINNLLVNFASHLLPNRNLRWKMGGMEIESNAIEIKKDELEAIVKEESQEKRLELFKKKFDIENTLLKLDNVDLEWLRTFSEDYNIKNSFLLWPMGEKSLDELGAFNRLEKLGLVKYLNIPFQGGEALGIITEKGYEIIKLLSHKKSDKIEK